MRIYGRVFVNACVAVCFLLRFVSVFFCKGVCVMCIEEEKKNEQGKEPEMSKEEYARTVRSLRDKISSFTVALFDCLEHLEYLEIEHGVSSGFDSDCDFMSAIKDSSDALDCLVEAIYRKYGDDDYEIIEEGR